MSLGTDQYGQGKFDKKNNKTDKYTSFKTDIYSILDDVFFDESLEKVVYLSDKHMGKAVASFLDEVNFMFYGGNDTDKCIHISLEKGTYQYVSHMDDKSKYDIPYDWVTFQNEIRDHVSKNPIIHKHSDVSNNLSDYSVPVVEEKELITGAKEYLEEFRLAYPNIEITDSQALEMAKGYIKKELFKKNKTTYQAEGNPELKLRSGTYRNFESLVKANGWVNKFEEDFGMSIRKYLNTNDSDTVEQDTLSDLGFEYLSDKIVVHSGNHWTRRKVDIVYDGELGVDDIDFQESDLPDMKKPITTAERKGGDMGDFVNQILGAVGMNNQIPNNGGNVGDNNNNNNNDDDGGDDDYEEALQDFKSDTNCDPEDGFNFAYIPNSEYPDQSFYMVSPKYYDGLYDQHIGSIVPFRNDERFGEAMESVFEFEGNDLEGIKSLLETKGMGYDRSFQRDMEDVDGNGVVVLSNGMTIDQYIETLRK